MTPIQCFLIEPILGDPLPEEERDEWPPRRFIKGWVRKDTGETQETTAGFGVGAMWSATWYPKNWTWDNEHEPHLIVAMPDGSGGARNVDVDSRASNCSLPADRLHRCWVRQGEPPLITVSKSGRTCAAGAGSFIVDNWHGYIKNGFITEK